MLIYAENVKFNLRQNMKIVEDAPLSPLFRSPKFMTEKIVEEDTLQKCERCGHIILFDRVSYFTKPRKYFHLTCFKIWRGREIHI